MALNNYQFQFGSFQFGGAGSPFQILDVDGLGLPDLRVQDDVRGYNDGYFSGRDFYGGRHLTFTLNIFAGNGNSAHQNWALMEAALIPQTSGTTQLQFQLAAGDSSKTINARVRGRQVRIDPEYTFGFIRAQVEMFCPNPKYYDQTVNSLVLVPASSFGRTYNRIYNMLYVPVSGGSTGVVSNNGWATTYPTITISGPATNPSILNLTTNQVLTANVVMGVNDVLVFDLENKTVLLNGTSVRNTLAGNSQWFGAGVGATNISFAASGSSSSTSATITYQNAYV